MRNKKITVCRLCSSKKLTEIVNFGNMPIGNNLQKSVVNSLKTKTYPLAVQKCDHCKHFQLTYEVSPNELYAKNYTYLSGVGIMFKEHLNSYAHWVIKKCKLTKGSLILDVGSNDGTCLEYFKKQRMKVLGVDPAEKPALIANKKNIKTINAFFDKKISNYIKKNYGEFDFITSQNVLAHTSKIKEIFQVIYELLKTKAYFCFEVGYFHDVLKNNFFDTIYHEHLDYHHVGPLIPFLKGIGFSIVFISTNNIQGGSLRMLCKKESKPKIYSQPIKFLNKEEKSILNKSNHIQNWSRLINSKMKYFHKYINKNYTQGKKIYGYGAPTKAPLLIKLSNISNMIQYVVEDNDLKVNKYLPKTKIKIVSKQILVKNAPDILIVFAWNFISDIMTKLKKDKIKGISVVVPLPNFKVYKL